jgi:hypothetical protein
MFKYRIPRPRTSPASDPQKESAAAREHAGRSTASRESLGRVIKSRAMGEWPQPRFSRQRQSRRRLALRRPTAWRTRRRNHSCSRRRRQEHRPVRRRTSRRPRRGVHYIDDHLKCGAIADSFDATVVRTPRQDYDVVEATSRASGLRRAITSLAPRRVCMAVVNVSVRNGNACSPVPVTLRLPPPGDVDETRQRCRPVPAFPAVVGSPPVCAAAVRSGRSCRCGMRRPARRQVELTTSGAAVRANVSVRHVVVSVPGR